MGAREETVTDRLHAPACLPSARYAAAAVPDWRRAHVRPPPSGCATCDFAGARTANGERTGVTSPVRDAYLDYPLASAQQDALARCT